MKIRVAKNLLDVIFQNFIRWNFRSRHVYDFWGESDQTVKWIISDDFCWRLEVRTGQFHAVYLKRRLPRIRVFSAIFQTGEEKKPYAGRATEVIGISTRFRTSWDSERSACVSWKQNAQLRSPLYPPSGPISILRILFASHDGYLTSQPGKAGFPQ